MKITYEEFDEDVSYDYNRKRQGIKYKQNHPTEKKLDKTAKRKCKCGKFKYSCRKKALSGKGNNKNKEILTVYKCRICHKWHLTSCPQATVEPIEIEKIVPRKKKRNKKMFLDDFADIYSK